jgi:hypothetical protein
MRLFTSGVGGIPALSGVHGVTGEWVRSGTSRASNEVRGVGDALRPSAHRSMTPVGETVLDGVDGRSPHRVAGMASMHPVAAVWIVPWGVTGGMEPRKGTDGVPEGWCAQVADNHGIRRNVYAGYKAHDAR